MTHRRLVLLCSINNNAGRVEALSFRSSFLQSLFCELTSSASFTAFSVMSWLKCRWTFSNPRKVCILVFLGHKITYFPLQVKYFYGSWCACSVVLHGFPLESSPTLLAFLLCPFPSFNSPLYADVPSQSIKVDQDIRVGEEGVGITSELKEHKVHYFQDLCCAFDGDCLGYCRCLVLSFLSFKGQEVCHWPQLTVSSSPQNRPSICYSQ